MKNIVIHYTDDDIDDLHLFKEAVERTHANVSLHIYNTGDDFLRAIQKGISKESIVFLDINMPGKSGFDVLKEMRKHENLKDVPVIIYSTSNDVKAIDVSKDIGANMYAVKPGSFSDLKKMISKVIEIDWEQFRTPPEDFVFKPL